MQIRLATLADIPVMLEMERQAEFAPHWNREQYEGLFSPVPPRRVALVADDAGVVVGFLVALSLVDEWEVESVVVDAGARRQGIGTALLRDLVRLAVRDRAEAIVLEARESNHAARQLYEKIGFEQEAMRKDYYQGPLEHALLYRLRLQTGNKIY